MKKLTEDLVTLIEEGDMLIMPSYYIDKKLKKVNHEFETKVLTVSTETVGDKSYFIGIVVKYFNPETKEERYRFFQFDEIEYKFKHESNINLLEKRLKDKE